MAHSFDRPELREFHRQLLLLADLASRLDEPALWSKPDSWTNPPGTLFRHIAGNASHYVGAGLLANGFRRDRESEFRAPPCPRESLVSGLLGAAELVERADRRSTGFAWSEPWTTPDGQSFESLSTHIARLTTHAAYHLGQCSVLARIRID